MQRLVRLAIGTVQSEADLAFVSWALMAAFEQAGLRVQNFSSRACFAPRDPASMVTGQATRHLDTWLLEPGSCLAFFERGARNSDFALVQGRFDPPDCYAEEMGGKLSTLCDWLELPSIVVLDARLLRDCQLPMRPQRLDAVLIEGTRTCAEQCRLQTWLEALWGVPVVGFINNAPHLRAEVQELASGCQPSDELCEALGKQVIPPVLLAQVLSIALSKQDTSQRSTLPMPAILPQRGIRVATAFDEAFHCYFPDALDQLEVLGAELVDFSPLRDDRLPIDTDLVYFGCGRPDLYAHQLSENCCMMAALKRHIEGGGRLYAECGGLAYLAEHIILPDGRRLPMSGVMPLVATMQAEPTVPTALEVSLAADCWMGEAGTLLRGYQNQRWKIQPTDNSVRCIVEDNQLEDAILSYQNAIGSCMHLNFAMLPTVLDRIFEPLTTGYVA